MGPVNLTLTSHYLVRARQRGYRPEDLPVMEMLGDFTAEGILLRWKDVAAEIQRLSATLRQLRHRRANGSFHRSAFGAEESEIAHEIERLQRLSGTFVPIEAGHALSIYRPSRRRLKRLLNGERTRRANRRYWR